MRAIVNRIDMNCRLQKVSDSRPSNSHERFMRVDNALEHIKSAHQWNEEQIAWLERLASSIKEKVVLDDDTFKTGNYKRKGGKQKLMNVFDDNLDGILQEFNEYVWDQPA